MTLLPMASSERGARAVNPMVPDEALLVYEGEDGEDTHQQPVFASEPDSGAADAASGGGGLDDAEEANPRRRPGQLDLARVEAEARARPAVAPGAQRTGLLDEGVRKRRRRKCGRCDCCAENV
jgi:hypothetical protein